MVYYYIYARGGGLAQWLASRTTDQGVSGSRPGRVAIRFGLEQVTFTPCLELVKQRMAVDVRLTWTDCDEAGDYVVPNVLSPRDRVFRPNSMNETVLHIYMQVFQEHVHTLTTMT